MDGLSCSVAVIGGGPAGLMAAEVMAAGGARVTVFDRMPSLRASSCSPAGAD